MSIWRKLKAYLGPSSKDTSDEEFREITIKRDGEDPLCFSGRLLQGKRIEDERFDLTLRLYQVEDKKIILESRYIDPARSVHKALEFDSIQAAIFYIQNITKDLQNDRVQEGGPIQ